MAKTMTKKTTTPKTEQVTEVVDVVEEVVETVETVEPVITKKTVVKEKKKFEPMEEVMCRSIVDGILVMSGIQSHNHYKWSNNGDVQGVEYRDLVSSVRSNTSYVTAPHFIIEDEDFLAEFPKIQKIYDSMYSTRDLKEILTLPVDAMMNKISKLPDGSKSNLKNIVGKMVLNGTLDSVKKIKALDAFYGTNFLITTNLY